MKTLSKVRLLCLSGGDDCFPYSKNSYTWSKNGFAIKKLEVMPSLPHQRSRLVGALARQTVEVPNHDCPKRPWLVVLLVTVCGQRVRFVAVSLEGFQRGEVIPIRHHRRLPFSAIRSLGHKCAEILLVYETKAILN